MLKLKKDIINFLKVNVKPICLERIIRWIEAEAPLHGGYTFKYCIDKTQSIYGIYIDFDLPKDCFEEIEDLKPYRWYPPEKWDGNPNGWLLLEQNLDGIYQTIDFNPRVLFDNTARFMYIETNEVSNED